MVQGIVLDEFVVRDIASGFDIQKFIRLVQQDTTFYKAFKSLRLLRFTMYNDIEIWTKTQALKASYSSISQQERENNCRKMIVKKEQVKGDFYDRKGNYNYHTAKLYAHLFFTKGVICGDHNIVKGNTFKGSTKYEEQLRMLIFNPGQRISGIPGIGKNVAIFQSPTFEKYNFTLKCVVYNEEECYVFKAIPKKEEKENVVINELKTWFRVSDYAIVARDYSLSFKTLLYDFDVAMQVKLKPIQTYLVPYEIHYRGNWHVFSRPREIATFTSIFTDFE